MKLELASKCSCCRLFPACETRDHLFFEGEWAAVIWRLFAEEFQLSDIYNGSFSDLFTYIFSEKKSVGPYFSFRRLMFSVNLWEIWRERCLHKFEEAYTSSVQRILFRVSDWRLRFQKVLSGSICQSRSEFSKAVEANLNPILKFRKSLEIIKWEKPEVGLITVNCDGSVDSIGNAGGGSVLQNSDGDFLGAASWYYGRNSIADAELLAVRDGLRFAQDLGFAPSSIVAESDSLLLVRSLKQNVLSGIVQKFNWKEILSKINQGCQLRHIFREVNTAADMLAIRGRISKKIYDAATLPRRLAGILFWEKHGLPYIRKTS